MTGTAAVTTYNQLFERSVRLFPDRVAFRLKTPEGYREVSYREIDRHARGVALGLAGMGLRAGARIAILSENRSEWVFAYLGVFLAGGTAVPLDTQISAAEWRRLLDDSDARVVFVSGHLLPRLREAVQNSPLVGRLICFDDLPGDHDVRAELSGLVEWGLALNPAPVLPHARPDDWVVLIYTSGTTGNPKGVMLTQGNIVAELTGLTRIIHVDENDALLCLLPLQHVLASVINVLLPVAIGAQVVFIDTLRRAEILEALETGGVTILLAVPQFFYLFYDQIEEELNRRSLPVRGLFGSLLALNRIATRLGFNLGRFFFRRIHDRFGERIRLLVSGGSAFDPKVARFFSDLGFTVLQGYGLTETTGACTATRPESNLVGSVGTAIPDCEVRVVDPDAAGVGEIAIRGPIVMKGYYRNPQTTAEVVKDGWLYSGDLGMIDKTGNVHITGRRKEVIVLPNGKNIYPDEIEAHYQQCPYIKEIAVLGITTGGSHETSERLHAVVVPDFEVLKAKRIANAREILRDEIGRWSAQLPKYKRLMSYQIQKEPLPRTTTRKIRRLELKKLIESSGLRAPEQGEASRPDAPQDTELKESAVGQEVLRCLRENYHRSPVELDMNLELDLGFDSMERVEFLASLEHSLSITLPEDFGAEILTVRDLIARIDQQTGGGSGSATAARQSWKNILSKETLDEEGEWRVKFSGTALTLFKYLGLRVVYLLSRIFLRLEVRGLENLPRDGPFLICPNHQSYIDPFIVLCVVPYRTFKQVFFVGDSEYFKSWFMKLLARLANIVPVDPDVHLLRAMKAGAYGLYRNRVLCIFPEGARSFDGELKEFKKGAAILAREIGVPIVPVALHGAYEVWRRDSWKIRPHKVKMIFGAPLAVGRDGKDPYLADTAVLRSTVAALLKEISTE
jgi:long-chain acyl-CoA synthetase